MNILRKFFGCVFLALGVLGFFLPVLQGIFFILVGLALLFPCNHHLRQLLEKAKARFPEHAARLNAFKERPGATVRRKN